MNKAEILHLFERAGAFLKGHFLLSSGLHSERYLQCAILLQDPKISGRLCGELAARFKDEKIDIVIGPAIGAIVVSYEVARALGVCSIFAERQEGRMALRRGFKLNRDERVLIVEDVVTTGKATKEIIDIIKASEAKLVGIGALVNRGRFLLDAKIESLINIDIPTYKPGDCPLCRDGLPIVKPGSKT